MNGTLGHIGVLLGFAGAVAGVVVLAVGLARGRTATLQSGQFYAPLIFLGGLLALGAMEHALLTHDFSLSYVAGNNSRSTPWLYSITGLWSALAGSILLWGVVLGGYATAMVWRFRRRSGDQLVGWATLVVYVVAAFFFGLMLGPADPFAHVVGAVPANGPGPNSLLQDNPLVLIHPPMLYLGLVGFTLPFAFAVASLVTGRLDEDWQGETRRWTLFAWAFLSMGILLGAWWSYQVLGWGGFWGWDPVENAALLPWLVGTAYLHSVMVQQRRGLLRIWNLSLVVATFSLTILGTFLTRSGVLKSVHSFSESTVGPLLLGFFGVVVATGVGLIAWRGDRLRSAGGIDSPISREGAFLANNLLFVGFAFVVLLGTVFPLLYEALNDGTQVGVGAPYFNRFFVPVGLALLFLMAVAPALPWRKSTVAVMRGRLAVPAALGVVVVVVCVLAGVHGIEPLLAFGLGAFAAASAGRSLVLSVRGAFRTARVGGASMGRAALSGWRGFVGRANGGMVVHIGVVVVAIGLAAATSYLQRGVLELTKGQTGTFAGHTVAFEGTRIVTTPSHSSFEALLRVDGRGVFTPAISQFGSGTSAVGTPAIDSSWRNDLYLTIRNIPQSSSGSAGSTVWQFGIVEQPLVMWLWIGAGLIAAGSVLAAIPGRRRRPTDPVSAPVSGAAPPPAPELRPDVEPEPDVVGSGVAPGARLPGQRGGLVTDAPSGTVPDPEPTGATAPDPVPARPRHTARWIAGTVLVIAAGLIAVLATRPPATVSELRSPVVGTMAPSVGGVTLAGTPFVLPRVPGKFVVLNFSASWCQPCQAEGPQLVSFAFRHQQAGDAEVVGVVFDDSPGAARAAQATLGATWPTLADPGGTIALDYGVPAPPSTFLIAPDGRVVAYIVSSVRASQLDALMARAKAAGA